MAADVLFILKIEMGGLWSVKGREAITTSQYHSRKKEIGKKR
jgi:hypothetical protein